MALNVLSRCNLIGLLNGISEICIKADVQFVYLISGNTVSKVSMLKILSEITITTDY